MREFKYIVTTQILAIAILSGVALGSFLGKTIYITKTVNILPEKIFPDLVFKKAMNYHGTLYATKEEYCSRWLFIDKEGIPRSLFIEK